MDQSYEARRKRTSGVRERQRRRKERTAMVTRRVPVDIGTRRTFQRAMRSGWAGRGKLLFQDALWYVRNTPLVMVIAAVVIGLYFLLFVGAHVVQGRLFPGVWAFGVYIGDMTAEEAELALLKAFTSDLRIQLVDENR